MRWKEVGRQRPYFIAIRSRHKLERTEKYKENIFEIFHCPPEIEIGIIPTKLNALEVQQSPQQNDEAVMMVFVL
jgi:hypothetical protein